MTEGTGIDKLLAAADRRDRVCRRIIKALEHWPREQAMACIMSWIPIDDLEEAAVTICKDLDTPDI
jgi:hypothetical protein